MTEFEEFGEDTYKIELNKIVICLKENNYVFTSSENAEDGKIYNKIKNIIILY